MFTFLTRPLVALDVETHDKGNPEEVHICDLGFKVFYPDKPEYEWSNLIRPPKPITEGATEVHGITNADVAQAPAFNRIANSLAKGFTGVDFCGYNVKFDLRVIAAEMERANVAWDYVDAHILDPLRLWQISEPRTLTDAVRRFLKREPRDAHRALGDALDAADVAVAMLEHFSELPKDMGKLHEMCFVNPDHVDSEGKFRWSPDGHAVFNFGKMNGKLLADVDVGYLRWMLGNNFSRETKIIVENALNGMFPRKVG